MNTQTEKLAALPALIDAGKVSHTRAGERLFRGATLIYLHDKQSPTGCTLWHAIDDCPELDALLRGGLSPLSPTERR